MVGLRSDPRQLNSRAWVLTTELLRAHLNIPLHTLTQDCLLSHFQYWKKSNLQSKMPIRILKKTRVGLRRPGFYSCWHQGSVAQPLGLKLTHLFVSKGDWSRKVSLWLRCCEIQSSLHLGEQKEILDTSCSFITRILQSPFIMWNSTERSLPQDDHLEQNTWALLKCPRVCSSWRPSWQREFGVVMWMGSVFLNYEFGL